MRHMPIMFNRAPGEVFPFLPIEEGKLRHRCGTITSSTNLGKSVSDYYIFLSARRTLAKILPLLSH
jgi:hypothetical protein